MGLCLLFLPSVPGATFNQGATSIPDSRVGIKLKTFQKILGQNPEKNYKSLLNCLAALLTPNQGMV